MFVMTKVSADSTCDLAKNLLETLDVSVTPLSVTVNGDVFKDGVDIHSQDIFSLVEEGKTCQTGAVNVYEYKKHFQELTKNGQDVIHIPLGAGFSSSYHSARLAAREFVNVSVVDSLNLSTGSGHLVYEAALMAAEGMAASEIAVSLERLVPRIDASFILDQLEYIARGGRCSTITAQGARMLRLKPCIEVRDGSMVVGRKYRGTLETALKLYVLDRLKDRDKLDPTRVFITHAGCEQDLVEHVRTIVQENADFEDIIVTEAGSTISNHCGPNTLGVLFKRL